MKVKDFLKWFDEIDKEKELKFELMQPAVDDDGDYTEIYSKLWAEGINKDDDNTICINFTN